MLPYNFNGTPVGDQVGRNMGMFPRLDPDMDLLREYPEEVREALARRGDEIHSAADLRELAEEEERKR